MTAAQTATRACEKDFYLATGRKEVLDGLYLKVSQWILGFIADKRSTPRTMTENANSSAPRSEKFP